MKKDSNKKTHRRLWLLAFLYVGVFFLIIYRLYDIQIRDGDEYRKIAENQYVSQISDSFSRGSIYFQDRFGNQISAATLSEGFTIALIPGEIKDPEAVFEQLSEYVVLDKPSFMRKAKKINDPYEELKKNVPREEVEDLLGERIPGVRFVSSKARSYPAGSLAAQTIGFVAYDEDRKVGRYGLERQYEELLAHPEDSLHINTYAGLFSDIEVILGSLEGKQGSIVTTIDPEIQAYVQDELKKTYKKWNAERVNAIVIDPKSGAVRAIESYPSFNPNEFGTVGNISVYQNPLVEYLYEVGSILKPLIVATGLDLGSVDLSTQYFDKGKIDVGDRTIYNYDKIGRGWVGVSDILSQSLNTGMVEIMQDIGKKQAREYLIKLGLTGESGIDLPGEPSPLVSNLESNRDVEFANISFGQGIAITPVGMIKALTAITSPSGVVTPYIAEEIVVSGVKKKINRAEPSGAVFSDKTREEITQMLVRTFDEGLRGETPELAYYDIAAKTGTAQIPNPQGGYYADRNLHSFFGFFPAREPKALLLLMIENPKNAKYSSETLADPFKSLVQFLIHHYAIAPDRLGSHEDITIEESPE